MEDFINRDNICLYNDKSYTYLHPSSGAYTAIDLTLCDPATYLDYNWKVHYDTYGSDRFPVVIENSGALSYWKLKKAIWKEFKKNLHQKPMWTILSTSPISQKLFSVLQKNLYQNLSSMIDLSLMMSVKK